MADLYGRTEGQRALDLFAVQEADPAAEERKQTIVDEVRIKEASGILEKYKTGKANLEARIVEDELWYELRHWEALRRQKPDVLEADPTSAWLFNAIMNKHADAMDNVPEPVVLPRERSDEESAKTLTSILPVLMEINDFEDTYSDNWWEKLKHGTGCYGVFWDSSKENGLGDVDVKSIDMLRIFWEPGIEDIQDSKNLFIVDLVDKDVLEDMYPEKKGLLKGNVIDVKEYIYDDTIKIDDDKVLVVDWYYKTNVGGRTTLQYCKFVGDQVLFASENDPQYRERGWYDHGEYPVVMDVLFPEKGTPAGFGLVAICKDPQAYIDKLYADFLQASMMGTRKRFFVSNATGVNEDEFANWTNQIVHVEGELSDARIQEINISPPSAASFNIIQQKIDEMKETSSNKDVNSGSSGSVTAASAIAALQEAGNKTSRDMISASYRAYSKIMKLVLECIRQFYDVGRSFRITGKMPSEYEYAMLSNARLRPQPSGVDSMGQTLFRKPVFDLKIKAQKKNPFSRMEENERAKELYGMGFFNPERAQEALGALDMMDFEGIDKVREQVSQGQTLLNILQQMQMQMAGMAQALGLAPAPGEAPEGQPGQPQRQPQGNPEGQSKFSSGIMQAQKPMTGYGQRLAQRSSPDMNGG